MSGSPKRARFLGASDDQVRYAGNSDPRQFLTVGAIYLVDVWKQEHWKTHVGLMGFPGKLFNSVCFEIDPPEELTPSKEGNYIDDHL